MKESPLNANQLTMFVVDVLRYDIEPVPSIINLLNDRGCIGWRNFWPHDFREEEVVSALEALLPSGMVQLLCSDQSLGELVPCEKPLDIRKNIDSVWFLLTPKGWRAWEEWDPPVEE